VKTKGTRIADLPARDLTHIFYAFGDVRSDGLAGIDDPGTNFEELARLKALNPHLKLAISIGGWTGSGRFSDIALTDSSRRRFVGSAVDLFIRQRPGLFDGIDMVRLKKHGRAFLTMAFGGPNEYEGRDLRARTAERWARA
jgi:chitinase